MSGGSFNYTYLQAEEVSTAFDPLYQGEYERMAEYLRSHWMNRPEIAHDIERYAHWLQDQRDAIEAEGKRMAELLQAVEWVVSSDWDIKRLDEVYAKFKQGEVK